MDNKREALREIDADPGLLQAETEEELEMISEAGEEAEVSPASDSHKVVRISLDDLPAGDGQSHGMNERYTKKLPAGITSRMLYKDILIIGWPALLEMMLTQLTGMFDLMQVGTLGSYAIAGVGVANQVKFLLMTTFMSLNVGVTSMIARARGANDIERARHALRQGFVLNFIASAVTAILGFLLAPALIRLLSPGDLPETVTAGIEYFQVNMIGFLFLSLTSTITAALRGVGNSRISLVYNTVANVVNVFLNWVLINGYLGFPRLEVKGAALATIIGQFVAFVIAMFAILSKKNYIRLEFRRGFRFDRLMVGDIVRIGLPAAIEQLIMRLGIFVYLFMINSLGTIASSTHQVCLNLQSLTFMNGQAFGVASTSLVGQSLGKKRPDMAQAYSKRCQTTGMTVAIVIGIGFAIFSKQLVALYDKDPAVIELGAKIMLLIALIQPFMSSQLILSGSMRGAGDTRSVAIITTVTVLVLRPLLTYIAIYLLNLGLVGAWYAMCIDQLVRTFFVSRRYVSGKWKSSFKARSEA